MDDAIEMAENRSQLILGPIVHNPLIVNRLAEHGIPILERYSDLDELENQGIDEVVITAHGYPKELKEDLSRRGIAYHDATCPVLLKWVYGKIRHFEAEGYRVIIIGNPNHAEIIASRSYGEDIRVVYSEEDVEALPEDLGRTAAVCQTTITRERFQRLVDLIRERRYPDLRAIDTRCKPVKNQQEAVERLSGWVDAMIIVGGLDSSNTTNLARISKRVLPDRTHHIDSADLVCAEWLDGVRHLGIGAGTSTPKEQIQDVQRRIAELYEGDVRFCREGREGELIDEDLPAVRGG